MSFLQDLGSFFEEAKQFSEELDTIKQEVVSSVVKTATDVKDSSGAIGSQIVESTQEMKRSVADVASEVTKSLPKK